MNQRNKFRGLYDLKKQHRSPDSESRMQASDKQATNDDSLEQIVQQFITDNEKLKPKKDVKNHSRSHSCPYELISGSEKVSLAKMFHHRSPSAIPEEHPAEMEMGEESESGEKTLQSKKLMRINSKRLPFAKKNSSPSIKSVVIHSNDANSMYLSSMLYSEKKIAEEEDQRKPTIKKASKRNIQKLNEDKFVVNRNKYLKMRLDQQIRKHQLSQDLQKVQKQANDISIKQMILEALLNKTGHQQKYLTADPNQSSIVFY